MTVTTSATPLTTAETDDIQGSSVLVTNRHASASVDVGDSGVTVGGGYELKAGESVTIDLEATSGQHANEGAFAIAASGTVRCDVLEQGV